MTPFQQPQPPMDPNAAQGQPPQPGMDPSQQQPQDPAQQQQAPDPSQMQQPVPPPPDADDGSGGDDMSSLIDYALSEANLAKKFKNKDGGDFLAKMGVDIYEGYMEDERSRAAWMDTNEEWLKMALLLREEKTFPWPKASNIKYPLIATAAMQFSARAYPALVPNDGLLVKAKVTAFDPSGQMQDAAIRVGRHMSYQVLCQMQNWEEDMDKLLMTMAVSGICFKKTYHDSLENVHRSCLVYPENLCINYYAKSIEGAYRKTELLYYTDNELREKVKNDEEFLDVEFGGAVNDDSDFKKITFSVNVNPPRVDKSTVHPFLACHTYWDLDGDGYEEPYIITVHKKTQQVVRIIARWDSDGVLKNEKGKIIKIKPVEYFTDFPFIPNPDGSIYACGFGMLLAPLNESVNTLINLLVDSGVLNNLSSGFIGKNLRIKMGQLQIRPGEWKVVNATGDDLSKSFFPMPTKEPSTVLMSLLQMLITSGNQLASIAEIFVGKMPGQNTTATTTQETIQQGMAVFTAIYKRVYRSMGKEFKKIFRLNRITPGILDEEIQYAGVQIAKSDYENTEHLIIPGADPSGDSATVRLMKLEQVGKLLELGVVNPMVFAKRVLEANEITNYQELLQQPPPPPPDPKIQTEQIKQQTMQQQSQSEQALNAQKLDLEKQLGEMKMQLEQARLQFKEQEQAMKLQGQQQQMHMDQVQSANEMQQQARQGELEMAVQSKQAEVDIATQKAVANQQVAAGAQQHKQKLKQGDESHKQKMTQAKQQAKVKPKNVSK